MKGNMATAKTKPRKHKGGRPKKIIMCQWCREEMGTYDYLKHLGNCPKRPGKKVA